MPIKQVAYIQYMRYMSYTDAYSPALYSSVLAAFLLTAYSQQNLIRTAQSGLVQNAL